MRAWEFPIIQQAHRFFTLRFFRFPAAQGGEVIHAEDGAGGKIELGYKTFLGLGDGVIFYFFREYIGILERYSESIKVSAQSDS